MDFTREPVIETVITPKEGCKLVVRSSKSSGQEEYFVDAVEVVSFGHSLFFRSLERPKAFLVPVSDYEILEVREARMVLKNVGSDRSIKIGGGREPAPKPPRESARESARESVREPAYERESLPVQAEEVPALAGEEALSADGRLDKKRGRRHYRRRRGSKDAGEGLEAGEAPSEGSEAKEPRDELKADFQPQTAPTSLEEGELTEMTASTSLILSSILPPPPTLISETIARYKDNAMFKGAFFVREEKTDGQPELPTSLEGSLTGNLEEPHKEAWISDEAEEEIFRHRAASLQPEEPVEGSPEGISEPSTPSTEPHESADAKEGHIPNNN